MVVFKYDYLKEQDIGALLGIKNIGINTRDVTISETKGTLLTNDVLIKHLSIKSNQLFYLSLPVRIFIMFLVFYFTINLQLMSHL